MERSVALQSKLLHEAGFEVHLAILNDHIDYEFKGELLNLGLFKGGKDSLLKRINRLKKLRHYLKQKQMDVVIDHRSKNQYLREVFYKKYLYRGFKTIYVTHSAFEPMYLTDRPVAFGRLCDTNVANVAVSEYIEDKLLKSTGMGNTHTIYNTWDPNWKDYSGALPSSLEGKKFFLFYGRLDDGVKDLEFLLKSYSQSNVNTLGVDLVIMGDGPDKDNLRRRAEELSIAMNVYWLDFEPHPQAVVSKAHAVVLCSRFEGFPMVLLESLALGTPVVSLDIVSGPSEIVQNEKNGLLVKERNTKAFANVLKLMVENEKLYRTCQSNAQDSVTAFDPSVIAAQWKKLLENV